MAKTFEDMFTHFDTIHKCDRHPARQTSRHHTSTCATLMHSTASQKAIHRKKVPKTCCTADTEERDYAMKNIQ